MRCPKCQTWLHDAVHVEDSEHGLVVTLDAWVPRPLARRCICGWSYTITSARETYA